MGTTPVITCAKINHYAGDTVVVIDGNMYDMVKNLPQYKFKVSLIESNYNIYDVYPGFMRSKTIK